jgi:hypothetical protein
MFQFNSIFKVQDTPLTLFLLRLRLKIFYLGLQVEYEVEETASGEGVPIQLWVGIRRFFSEVEFFTLASQLSVMLMGFPIQLQVEPSRS